MQEWFLEFKDYDFVEAETPEEAVTKYVEIIKQRIDEFGHKTFISCDKSRGERYE